MSLYISLLALATNLAENKSNNQENEIDFYIIR